ncbi:MAG: hypothetical protein EHM42_04890 [Planctomycetaceae bacterium]|nr:MAG: hypothetical protein EHM42_04890 [Planctomycetaceae bacterium]
MAARAARTGVLVLSTVHANDAAASFDVFRDFGVPAMFIADSIICVIAQRLIRKVCPDCRVLEPASETEKKFLAPDVDLPADLRLARGTGCASCFNSGYAGRTGLFEIISVDEDIKQLLLAGSPRAEIVRVARSKGMYSLQTAAARKVVDGTTTLQEMHRLLLTEPL